MAVRKPTKRAVPQRRAPRATRAPRIPKRKPDQPFWEWVVELRKTIPPEELAHFPADGATNLDHYLYGAPKQEP